ncbi:hypothetical protein [Bradyrhizobium valentinum]|uniref:Phage tail protein n=1 Tax=Bradyrhizobium valentinum TaxID=1518501 RepID=A0A0R3KUN7_9BRAD|nr:hypothetical protein [Bradyrhizobium valentinum]KRQ99286.1 hypothetical protein CP49_11865 [Bradyrhizobium valentinum]
MAVNPNFGFSFIREANEPAPPSNAIMSVVGLCGPATKKATVDQTEFDAAFPLNVPVMFTSTDATAQLIEPTSRIGDALSAINSQLGRMQRSARVIYVRTEEDADADATKRYWNTVSNIIGNSVGGTGIWAFKRAGAVCGAYPRLVCVPGFTDRMPNGVASITVTAPGANYNGQPTVSAAGANGSGFVGEVVLGTGADAGKVMSIRVLSPGNYTAPPVLTIEPQDGEDGNGDPFTGAGATATATLDALANPIAATLPAVLNSYLGVAVIDAPPSTEAAALDYRETLSSNRLIIVDPDVKVLENGVVVHKPASPRIIGVAVRRDFEYEGRPFHSWANQPIYGIVGPGRNIEFSLTDGATEGQDLLGHQIGPIVRGETGDDFAIAEGGFVFVGYENVGEDAVWQQYHKVRGRDFIELTVLRTLRYYLGKFNLTTHTIQTVVNVVGNLLNIAQSKGDILGYLCRFDPDQNNPDDLRTGKIYVDARFEEAPMFRLATILSRPHRPALEQTIATLTASTVLTEAVQ